MGKSKGKNRNGVLRAGHDSSSPARNRIWETVRLARGRYHIMLAPTRNYLFLVYTRGLLVGYASVACQKRKRLASSTQFHGGFGNVDFHAENTK